MIKKASIENLDEVDLIMKEIKEEMRKENNPQWGSTEADYPSKTKLKEDIINNRMYIYIEDNIIKGVLSIVEDDGEYNELLKNSPKKAYILHRLAISKKYRNNSIASKLMKFAEKKAKENIIKVLKSDTEISNDKMNNLFIKEGYKYIGRFSYNDYPGIYNYYEKEI